MWLSNGSQVSSWSDENILEVSRVGGAQHLNAVSATELFTSKWFILRCVDFTSIKKIKIKHTDIWNQRNAI